MLSAGTLTALAGFSAFGVLFLSLLAILIKSGYPYVGEWYTTEGLGGKSALPLADQQESVVRAIWQAVFVYLVLGGLSMIGLAVRKIPSR
jgi:hypothetical protein